MTDETGTTIDAVIPVCGVCGRAEVAGSGSHSVTALSEECFDKKYAKDPIAQAVKSDLRFRHSTCEGLYGPNNLNNR